MTGRELEPTSFDALSGWAADDHDAALAAFQHSAREIIDQGTFGFVTDSLSYDEANALYAGAGRNQGEFNSDR